MYTKRLQVHPQNPLAYGLLLLGVVIMAIGHLVVPTNLRPAVTPDVAHLPMMFVPNYGQTDAAVQFQAHDANGSRIFFTPEGMTIVVESASADTRPLLQIRFDGANSDAQIQSSERLPGHVNYIQKQDAANWQTNVPTYAGISYVNLYPGIDLHYEGVQGNLKSTYIVAPGANPNDIRWQQHGATNVRIDQGGNLVLTMPAATGTEIVEQAPIAWQDINGQRIPVDANYTIAANGSIGFQLGAYDPRHSLTIDPILSYSTYLGGSLIENAEDIAVDSQGNALVVGTTMSSDFPTANAAQGERAADDVFIAKLSADGSTLLYSTFWGGSEDEQGSAIAVDNAGNAYITGATDSSDLPIVGGISDSLNGLVDDAFAAKLDPSGSIVYSTYLGGSSIDEGLGIAVDSQGNAYVAGLTDSPDFALPAPRLREYSGEIDGFVAKLNPAGDALVLGTFLGGSDFEETTDVAVDGSGNIYLIGDTLSSDFPTQNPLQGSKGAGLDSYVTSINAAGTAFIYSTFLGGSDNDYAYGIALDNANAAYITGVTESSDFPTANALQGTYGGGSCDDVNQVPCGDAYITKINSAGNALEYSTFFGGSGDDFGYDIAVDTAGSAYVTGSSTSSDLPTEGSLFAYAGDSDAYALKLTPAGDSLVYSTYIGGSAFDAGSGIAVDAAGSAFIVGVTQSSNFPTENPIQATNQGALDAFVLKLAEDGTPPPPMPEPTDDPTPEPTDDPTPEPTDDPMPEPTDDPTPEPTDDPTPEPTNDPVPGPRFNLSASIKVPSSLVLAAGETLTYRILLYNNGIEDASVEVTDVLPEELSYLANSSDDATFDADTNTLRWEDVDVPAGKLRELSYDVEQASAITLPRIAINTATIRAGERSINRSAAILLAPGNASGDVSPPNVENLTIDSQDVLTDTQVILTIEATDNVSVTEMYIREWYLNTSANIPRWEVVQSSGWVSYSETFDWELGDTSGTHFVGVWVADAAGNTSWLDWQAIDFASIVQAGETVPQNRSFLYQVYYDAGEEVNILLSPDSGDADLFVWYPSSFLFPNQNSTASGTSVEEVTFTTPNSGTYLIVVYGFEESTFDLSITPAGGSRITRAVVTGEAVAANSVPSPNNTTSKDSIDVSALLQGVSLDPLSEDNIAAPSNTQTIYLPFVRR